MQMRVIHNDGCGECLLMAESNGFGLIASPEKGEVIVARMSSNPNKWHCGIYFNNLKDALAEYGERTKRGIK